MGQFFRSADYFLKSEEAAAAVEYAVMLALIIGVCISSVSALGRSANSVFGKVGAAMDTAKASSR
jgi:pilus assembly protein Flp/PilA